MVDDLRPRKVKHELISGPHRAVPIRLKCPFRMCAVEIAVLIHHLGLKPDAEEKSHRVDVVRELLHRSAELLFICRPVAETAVVIVALPEPAIIEDEHVNAEVSCIFRELTDLRAVK